MTNLKVTCENCDAKITIGIVIDRSVFCLPCGRHTQIEVEKLESAEIAKVQAYTADLAT